MAELRTWLAARAVLAAVRRLPFRPPPPAWPRQVERGRDDPRAELRAAALFAGSAVCAIAFVVVYALDRLPAQTQLLGLSLGLALLLLAAGLLTLARRVLPEEEVGHPYPQPHPEETGRVAEIVEQGADSVTRRRLLLLAGGGAVGALGVAAAVPAASLGPLLDLEAFRRTPWRAGVRLVLADGAPLVADEVAEGTFYTAYPEGADRQQLGAPVVVVRLSPDRLALPTGRESWAPDGILAYSKICTHAGCAVTLYRTPTWEPTSAPPALVCPCHYSTFDPATGGRVTFGPAGRELPQLPLAVDEAGALRAGGGFSDHVGPSWWGVRT